MHGLPLLSFFSMSWESITTLSQSLEDCELPAIISVLTIIKKYLNKDIFESFSILKYRLFNEIINFQL